MHACRNCSVILFWASSVARQLCWKLAWLLLYGIRKFIIGQWSGSDPKVQSVMRAHLLSLVPTVFLLDSTPHRAGTPGTVPARPDPWIWAVCYIKQWSQPDFICCERIKAQSCTAKNSYPVLCGHPETLTIREDFQGKWRRWKRRNGGIRSEVPAPLYLSAWQCYERLGSPAGGFARELSGKARGGTGRQTEGSSLLPLLWRARDPWGCGNCLGRAWLSWTGLPPGDRPSALQ